MEGDGMSLAGSAKPVIVMQPGPLHLFWTTGVFYFWVLKKDFNFVFIVPENYRDHVRFQKVANMPSVRHVEYLQSGGLACHRQFSKKFKSILSQFRPSSILLHNRSYVENQYLIYWSRKLCPESPRYHYQNGRVALMWESDFAARRAGQIEEMSKKFSWLSEKSKIIGKIVDLRNGLAYVANFKLRPLLSIGALFDPPVNVFTGHVNIKATKESSNSGYDFLLAYLDNEIEAYRSQGIENIVKVRHPLSDCAEDVFKSLYDGYAVSDSILILPSYGFTSRMLEDGWDQVGLISHISGKWIQGIEKLLEKYPGFEVKMKVHPLSLSDPIWRNILAAICKRYPELKSIDPKESAEWHVVQSKVIVGDVTTVLWWAGLYGGKTVISLDIFKYAGGDEMRLYQPLVNYICDVDAIGKIDGGNEFLKFDKSILDCIQDTLRSEFIFA